MDARSAMESRARMSSTYRRDSHLSRPSGVELTSPDGTAAYTLDVLGTAIITGSRYDTLPISSAARKASTRADDGVLY